MHQRLRPAAALAAALTLACAPAMAHADRGLHVSIGRDAGFWLGDHHHAHVRIDHSHAYWRLERELRQRRAELLARTRRALAEEDFEAAQRRLARLLQVDRQLQDHRDEHRRCDH